MCTEEIFFPISEVKISQNPRISKAFTIHTRCSRLSRLSLLELRNRDKENRGGNFPENYGKGVSTATWPGWNRRDIDSTDEKRVLGKKKYKAVIRDHME